MESLPNAFSNILRQKFLHLTSDMFVHFRYGRLNVLRWLLWEGYYCHYYYYYHYYYHYHYHYSLGR